MTRTDRALVIAICVMAALAGATLVTRMWDQDHRAATVEVSP